MRSHPLLESSTGCGAGRAGRFAAALGAIALAAFVVLGLTVSRAPAAETIYWDNYSGIPNDSVGFANIDGNGGGLLSIPESAELEGPEGMAYDPVTNRLFVANEGGSPGGQITSVNLGNGAVGSFTASGAPIEEPEGVAVDPVTRTIFWINTTPENIAWARLDGSAGGVLNTTGATLEGAFRIAVDPVGGRVYWGNIGGSPSISFARTDNSGGGDLNTTGATPPSSIEGIATDPAGGRVYWLDDGEEQVSYANLGGGGGGDVNMAGAVFNEPYGLAFDSALGKLFWGNYGNGEEAAGAFGTALIAGGNGGIDIATAPVAGPQDPVILKSPAGTGAPQIVRNGTTLSCSQGSWSEGNPGGFVYQAPRSYAYQWSVNGAAIPGATANAYAATGPGSYACSVTATNQTGAATQTSAAISLAAGKLALKVRPKKARTKPNRKKTYRATVSNSGDFAVSGARLCVKRPKKAKKAVKVPKKCRSLGTIAAHTSRTVKFKVKALRRARGTYKLTVQVRGAGKVKAAKPKLQVKRSKKKKS